MKKIIKIVFILFSWFFLVFSIVSLIEIFPDYMNALKVLEKKGIKNSLDLLCNKQLIKYLCFVVCSILLFIVVNFKGLRFITESLTKNIIEYYKSTKEKRKQAKIQRMEKQLENLRNENDGQ